MTEIINSDPRFDDESFNLDELRQHLSQRASGGQRQQVWRSLAELAETPKFLEQLRHEFPRQTSWAAKLNRRDFLKLLAAPLAMAGLTACMPQPTEILVPYQEAPAELTPGVPLFYATAMELDGYGRGLLVENREGRPVKIEGNPLHPDSLGATDAIMQGSLLDLYDPVRTQVITQQGDIRTRESFAQAVNVSLSEQRGTSGAGLRILTGTVTSPTLTAQLRALLTQYPQAKWHQYDPIGRDNVRNGTALAFGSVLEPRYNLSEADVIVSLDSDFMTQEPGSLRYVREFATRRDLTRADANPSRLYVIESSFTVTGGNADHRLPIPPSQIAPFAQALAARLGVPTDSPGTAAPEEWLAALADDLNEHAGRCLVIPGLRQPPVVHALAHSINATLGNVGTTVIFTAPVESNPVDQMASLRELVNDLNAGSVELLVILSENPAYASPADLNLAEAITKAKVSVYHSLFPDETSTRTTWHIPAAHYLESWSDTRAFDGSVSIIQPLVYPLYNGLSRHELLAVLLGQGNVAGYDLVRQYWEARWQAAGEAGNGVFNRFWNDALRNGLVPETAAAVQTVQLSATFRSDLARHFVTSPISQRTQDGGLEILYEPDHSIWDGRFFNNSWLQELPRPLTKLTWDNAALVSPGTAQALGLANHQIVELTLGGRTRRAPVWILPGLPEGTVLAHLGYGQAGARADDWSGGYNAYALRTSTEPWFASGLELRQTGGRYPLACTQDHSSMEGRALAISGTLAEYHENPEFVHEYEHVVEHPGAPVDENHEGVAEPPSLYPEYDYERAWGMTINLSACIGCGACTLACQAENNIPVVGKSQVENGREMHWIRVDRYFEGEHLDNPPAIFQPIPCMHCENAPCEPVCPVNATVHSSEGLNEMVYSRCIGTRYCSNNCPYKVRRFNFLQYSNVDLNSLVLLQNPDVTVRDRGVMEKCTFCSQRISRARIQAKINGTEIADGDIVPACAQACPANAIVFGDIKNPESMVRQIKGHALNYSLLGEIGTQPRTTYIARVRNPNPRLTALEEA